MAFNKSDDGTGPQGTQMFSASEVNLMIAEEIVNAQSEKASSPAFIGLSAGLAGERYYFDEDGFTVGRNADNHIVLSEASVSATHAKLRPVETGWKLMNMLSSNGTFVNGEKVTEKIIRPGDRVAFAEVEFLFAHLDAPEKSTAKSKKTTDEKPSKSKHWLALTIVIIVLGTLAVVLTRTLN